MTTRVLIVEDEPEFIRRFSNAVLDDAALSLIAAVGTGTAGLAMLDLEKPDVLIIDLGLPDMHGVQLISHAARTLPDCDVLVVTMFADDANVVASIAAGASGYLLKDASAERISASIHELRAGGAPISPGIARRVLERFRVRVSPPEGADLADLADVAQATQVVAAAGASTKAAAEASPLTARETELLRMVAKGFTFDTIGTLLEISPHTVVAHVKKIYRKLAVHSRSEAVYEANQMGLL